MAVGSPRDLQEVPQAHAVPQASVPRGLRLREELVDGHLDDVVAVLVTGRHGGGVDGGVVAGGRVDGVEAFLHVGVVLREVDAADGAGVSVEGLVAARRDAHVEEFEPLPFVHVVRGEHHLHAGAARLEHELPFRDVILTRDRGLVLRVGVPEVEEIPARANAGEQVGEVEAAQVEADAVRGGQVDGVAARHVGQVGTRGGPGGTG